MPARCTRRRWLLELLLSDVPKEDLKPGGNELFHWANQLGVQESRFEARHQPACDASHPAMSVNLDACIQCTRCVRACPRGAGERRHRLRIPRPRFEDRFRLRRSHGRIHVRGVRRMRPGLPHGALAPCEECVQGRRRQAGRFGLSVLWSRVPDHVPREGQRDHSRGRARWTLESRAPVRQGPFRFRLCEARAAPHDAAHPQAGRAQERGPRPGSHALERGFQASVMGRGARRGGERTEEDTRYGRIVRPGGIRQRQGLQRRGVPLPETHPYRLRHNNVDHCTRLCHASSVAALLEGIGSGAVSNQVSDVALSEFILLIGANPSSNHRSRRRGSRTP